MGIWATPEKFWKAQWFLCVVLNRNSAGIPGKEEPVAVPGKGGEAMVCVQATRASQTPPLIVPDIHRVLEGTGLLECPDHKLDHGVLDSSTGTLVSDIRALKQAREVPILTFDFSGRTLQQYTLRSS